MPLVIKMVTADGTMTERDAEQLVRYVRTARAQDSPEAQEEKLAEGFGGALNMPNEEASASVQALWFKNLMRANGGRGKRPLLHHVLSWDKGDPLPTPAQVREAVQILERRLGLEGCACFWAGHRNTDHFHVHVVSCQIDSATHRMRRIGMAVRRTMEAQCEVSERLGLGHYERERYEIGPDGGVVRKPEPETPPDAPKPLPGTVQDMEQRTGEEAAIRSAQTRLWPIIKGATTWAEMHVALAAVGSAIKARKGGLVVLSEGRWIKASSISSSCSRKALENGPKGAPRGLFQPAPPELTLDAVQADSASEASRPRPTPAPKRSKPKAGKPKKPAKSSMPEEAPLEPSRRTIVPALGMDSEVRFYWWRWRREEIARKAGRRRWAVDRAAERRAVQEAVQEEMRRVRELTREEREKNGPLVRGALGLFLDALEAEGRRRRRAVSDRQQAQAGQQGRYADSFARWLLVRMHRPDLAERWRRRRSVKPVMPAVPKAGGRLVAAAWRRKNPWTVWTAAGVQQPEVRPQDDERIVEDLFDVARRLRGDHAPAVPEAVLEPEEDTGPNPY